MSSLESIKVNSFRRVEKTILWEQREYQDRSQITSLLLFSPSMKQLCFIKDHDGHLSFPQVSVCLNQDLLELTRKYLDQKFGLSEGCSKSVSYLCSLLSSNTRHQRHVHYMAIQLSGEALNSMYYKAETEWHLLSDVIGWIQDNMSDEAASFFIGHLMKYKEEVSQAT